jgi:peptidoglycan/xylan/chitin deacetylase (PgdA/CDA1 family)
MSNPSLAVARFILAALLICGWESSGQVSPSRSTIGVLPGDPLVQLGLKQSDLEHKQNAGRIGYLGKTKYLNHARAVVTHTIDDSSKYVPDCIDAMDKYGIKATVFVSTRREPISALWPRLRLAIRNGHEIGSHSRTHQCKWPDTDDFCRQAYSEDELAGSRDDILASTDQPYVWSWAYPCGNCARFDFIHQRLAQAGYLAARTYPDEEHDGHVVPDLKTYAENPYSTAYTQVVQKMGGIAKSGRTDVPTINTKFDQVYKEGGIYSFLSHPQWLDYGPDSFYEQHLAHVSRRPDVWYVPMGPLYAYRTVREKTTVSRVKSSWKAESEAKPKRAAASGSKTERFAVYNELDSRIYNNSVTLEFSVPEKGKIQVAAGGKAISERSAGITDRWSDEYFRRGGKTLFVTVRPNTVLEFRMTSFK